MNRFSAFVFLSVLSLSALPVFAESATAEAPVKIDRGYKVEVQPDGLPKKVTFKAKDLFKHAEYLASERCEGRLPGTQGHVFARQYIIDELEDAGFEEVKWLPFSFVSGVKMGERNGLNAQYTTPPENQGVWYRLPTAKSEYRVPFSLNDDYRPLRISESGKAENAPVVFAGYGISAPDKNYDDYKDLDVKGKVVLVLRKEPETAEGKRIGMDKADPHAPQSMFSDLFYKASTARDKGAAALVVVYGPRGVSNAERAALDSFERGTGGRTSCGLPLIQVFPEVADDWLRPSGKTIAELQKAIDEKLAPQSFEAKGVNLWLNVDVTRERTEDANLAVVLPGNDPVLKNEIIVIGAHFDHLGRGNEFSLADKGDMGKVHCGADDNASGTSSLIEVAKALHKNRKNLKRTVWIIFFSAEEMGTLGSIDFVKQPPAGFEVKNISAMLNMDMVGRCREKKVMVYGAGTGVGFESVLAKANEPLKLELKPTADGFGGSDQTPFVNAGVPVLFYFTGSHGDYHKPSDTADKLNVADQATITALVYNTAAQLVNAPERPKFVKLEAPKMSLGIGRVRLGTMPDYAFEGKGMRITGVRGASAADKAGIKGGDVIVKLGDKRVDNIQDYMIALNLLTPGLEAQVVVLREGKEVELKVTPDKN